MLLMADQCGVRARRQRRKFFPPTGRAGTGRARTLPQLVLFRLLRSVLAKYRRSILIVVVLQFAQAIAGLLLPRLNADIIDRGVVRGQRHEIWIAGGWMVLASVAQALCAIGAVYVGGRVAMGVGRDLRADLFGTVGRFSTREVEHFGPPSLITRITNDVQQVQLLVLMVCTLLIGAPITAIGGTIMALREDPPMVLVLAVALPVMFVIIFSTIRRMVPAFGLMQERIDGVNRVLREQLMGVRVVRAFVRERAETERFGASNAGLTGTALRAGRAMAVLFPTVMLTVNLSSVATLWFGARRVNSGALSAGELVAFLSYLAQILMSAMFATFIAVLWPRSAVCAERIVEVLDTTTSVPIAADAVAVAPGRATVELAAATFRYPGASDPVLRDISFVAGPGRTTAIVGSTGAGKTTLINLIVRLYDVTGGAVVVDGLDVRAMLPEALWQRFGLVPQRAYLFGGTVASNLRVARPEATDEELWEVLRVAQAADFVGEMPGGLEAPIVQGGTNVSGGQRQRLCIARALLRRAEIYLFDDSFSALDVATDARLRAALRPYVRDAAVIVVAQRVSTILHADQILVLDGGVLVGRGTHAELLESCPTYQEIVTSQLAVADDAETDEAGANEAGADEPETQETAP